MDTVMKRNRKKWMGLLILTLVVIVGIWMGPSWSEQSGFPQPEDASQGINNTTKPSLGNEVWPVDANADGRRNMNDLIPNSLRIQNEISGSRRRISMVYPPDPTTMNQFYASAPSQYLVDGINSLTLKTDISLEGVIPSIVNEEQFSLQLPFLISTANGSLTPSIFGTVFTRPLSGSKEYPGYNTEFDFGNSDIVNATDQSMMSARQKFWNLINIMSDGKSCGGVVDNPLDVGFFKTEKPLVNSGPLNSRYGTCTVTLLDILRTNGGASFTVDIEQHLINGLLYTLDGNKLVVNAIKCTSERTIINLGNICNSGPTPMLRDGFGDNGTLKLVSDSAAWANPDIWVRHTDDRDTETQNPILGDTEYVYIRVFNQGCARLSNVAMRSSMTSLDEVRDSDAATLLLKTPSSVCTWAKLTLSEIEGSVALGSIKGVHSIFGNLEILNLSLPSDADNSKLNDPLIPPDGNARKGNDTITLLDILRTPKGPLPSSDRQQYWINGLAFAEDK